jgi:hypothetical protein
VAGDRKDAGAGVTDGSGRGLRASPRLCGLARSLLRAGHVLADEDRSVPVRLESPALLAQPLHVKVKLLRGSKTAEVVMHCDPAVF